MFDMEVGFVGGLVTRKWISSSSSSTISARRLYMSSDVQTSSVTANTLRVDLGPLKVSPIGVGTWAWGDQLYWGSGGDEKVGKIPGQIRLNVESSKSGIDPGNETLC